MKSSLTTLQTSEFSFPALFVFREDVGKANAIRSIDL